VAVQAGAWGNIQGASKLDHRYEEFYGRMGTDGRLTVPKVTVKEFLKSDEESLDGYAVEVTLYPIVGEEEDK